MAFGGPLAHIAYFHKEFVQKRKWLDESQFQELVALTQSLPGPASSQLGMSIGKIRGGYIGSFAAWLGFTSPSIVFLLVLAFLENSGKIVFNSHFIHGLKLGTCAVVFLAIFSMGKRFCYNLKTLSISILAMLIVLSFQFSLIQVIVILFSAILGVLLFRSQTNKQLVGFNLNGKNLIPILITIGLFFLLPLISHQISLFQFLLFEKFFRIGSLVFGGGHVVLALLKTEFVDTSLLNFNEFMTGYSFANLMPGPLFSISAYIGYFANQQNSISNALISTIGIFFPSFLLIWSILPIWSNLRMNSHIQAALVGTNAAVVGLLAATFFHPLITSSVHSILDISTVLVGIVALHFLKAPSFAVLLISGAVSVFLF